MSTSLPPSLNVACFVCELVTKNNRMVAWGFLVTCAKVELSKSFCSYVLSPQWHTQMSRNKLNLRPWPSASQHLLLTALYLFHLSVSTKFQVYMAVHSDVMACRISCQHYIRDLHFLTVLLPVVGSFKMVWSSAHQLWCMEQDCHACYAALNSAH